MRRGAYYDGQVSRALGLWMLLLALAVASVAATPSQAATTIDVEIESVSPQLFDLSQPEQRITITGRFRNTTDAALGNVTVHFWRSTEPIATHDELEQALNSEPTQPWGRRLPELSVDQRDPNNEAALGDVAAGAEVTFTVSATVKDLALPTNDMVYLLGAHVRGQVASGGRETVGRARVLTIASSAPIPLTSVVKLTAPPTLLGGTEFRDDSLATSLNGDLQTLLTAAEQPGVQVLIDPAFVAEVHALSNRHSVAGEPREGNTTAADYAKRLDALITSGRAQRLPFGNPDLSRLHIAGGLVEVERCLEWAETALKAESMDQLAALPLAADLGQEASQDLALTLALHGFNTIYGDNILISGVLESTNNTPTGIAIRTSYEALPGIGPDNTMTEVQTTGRRLAEGLLGNSQTVRLIRQVDDLASGQPLAGLETTAALPSPQTPARFDDTVTRTPIPWTDLEQGLNELFLEAQLLQELTGTDRSALNAAVAVRSSSANFTTQAEALAYLNATPVEQLDAEKVRLSVPNQVVMGSDTNYFPATVHNPLDVPVTVQVLFTSDAQKRLTVLPSELVTLAPGEHRTVNLTTETTANGVVLVRGQLATQQGTRFGAEVPVEITATGLGRVGWIIIIISGAVVLGGTFLRIRAVQRERAKVNSE